MPVIIGRDRPTERRYDCDHILDCSELTLRLVHPERHYNLADSGEQKTLIGKVKDDEDNNLVLDGCISRLRAFGSRLGSDFL